MYTKHVWESDRHFNFRYVKYLPKDFDENKKYPLVFFLQRNGYSRSSLVFANELAKQNRLTI